MDAYLKKPIVVTAVFAFVMVGLSMAKVAGNIWWPASVISAVEDSSGAQEPVAPEPAPATESQEPQLQIKPAPVPAPVVQSAPAPTQEPQKQSSPPVSTQSTKPKESAPLPQNPAPADAQESPAPEPSPAPAPENTPPPPSPDPSPPEPPPQQTVAGEPAQERYYTSSYRTSKYYYPESCSGWKSLSENYLRVFDSLAELLAEYPSKTESPSCD